jgi:hypothetical protein
MTELYSMLVFLKNNPNAIRFLFKSESSVTDAYAVMTQPGTPLVEIHDDYSNTALIDRSAVAVCVKTYCNDDFTGQGDFSILQAHAQAKLQRRAQTDPMLKTGIAMPNGPMIKPPMN